MARTKKAPAKKATTTSKSKSSARKKPATKASAKKKVTNVAAKKSSPKKVTAKSVDSVLKKYEQERVASAKELQATVKKIQQLTDKIESYTQQVAELRKKKTEAEMAIATTETRRDEEIGTMLCEIGVNVQQAAAAVTRASKQKESRQEPTLFEKPSEAKAKPADAKAKSADASAKPAKTGRTKIEVLVKPNSAKN